MIYLRNTTESQQVYIPRQVIQTATTREVNYITSGDVINMIDSKLEDYWNSGETEAAIDDAISAESARCEETYAKPSDIPDVSEFITSGQAQEQINNSLSGFATEQWVEDKHYLTEHQSLSAYSTTEQVEDLISTAISAESARTEETYAKQSDIPDVSDFVDSGEVQTQINNSISGIPTQFKTINDESIIGEGNIEIETGGNYSAGTGIDITNDVISVKNDLLNGLFNSVEYVSSAKTIVFYDKTNTEVGTVDATDFIKDGMVDSVYISGSTLYIVFNTDAGKETIEIDLTQIFDPNNYYTKQDIDNKHFVDSGQTQSQIEAYSENFVTSAEVETQISDKNYVNSGDVKTQIEGYNYITSGDLPDVSDFVTSADVKTQIDGAIATESARTEETYAKQSDIPDVSDFVDSADVKTQVEEYNYINSGQAQTQIDDNLSAYTKTSDFATINGSGITEGGNLVIEGGSDSGLTQRVDELEEVTSRALNDLNNQFSAYTPTDNFATINGSGITNGGNIEIQGGGATYTAGDGIDITNDVISVTGKQETLVSGTNIKTINNESILGQGNIEIQGGGNNYIELTQAEYNALSAYQEDALYVISDAEEVDLNNFVTSGDLQTFSAATVSALNTKANAANVTARSVSYLPRWNSQGIITGDSNSQVYSVSMNVNGTSYGSILRQNSSNLATIYAPTTAGSQGQPLISNGSGAPVWASFKFWYGTETEYDAITTKDSNTIYFVKPD